MYLMHFHKVIIASAKCALICKIKFIFNHPTITGLSATIVAATTKIKFVTK